MTTDSKPDSREQDRNLLFMATPDLWTVWPFLPLMRRKPGCEEECGVMYDLYHLSGQTGFSCTVFFTNLFLLPPDQEQFLALPKEIYDTVEDIYAAGWRVD
jgi:hypothetical protein